MGSRHFSPSPRASYSDFDDFGVARSYGFKRQHLGHDMMGQVGTPVVAGIRLCGSPGLEPVRRLAAGIRSFDHKRYYYYAHLAQELPLPVRPEVGAWCRPGRRRAWGAPVTAAPKHQHIDDPSSPLLA